MSVLAVADCGIGGSSPEMSARILALRRAGVNGEISWAPTTIGNRAMRAADQVAKVLSGRTVIGSGM